jgi:uncharacterized protein YnzC (UPF0291/DUF896 family)
MDDKDIKRLNELYHKAKTEGLNDDEKVEQGKIRAEYIASVKRNLRAQLNNVSILNQDGTTTDLSKKLDKD